MEHVTEELSVGEVNETELVQLIVGLFGHGIQSRPNEVEYSRQGEPCALKLNYRRNRLVSIEAGSGLKREDLELLREKVQSELLSPSEQIVGRAVLFSAYPVTACFESPSFLQILPVPSEAPRPSFTMGEHPFLIEFVFPGSSNWMIRLGRRVREAHRLALFLDVVLEGGIRDQGLAARHHWIILSSEPAQKARYAYCQEGYGYAGFRPEGGGFSSLKTWGPMKRADPKTYFSRWGIESGRPLEIPTNMERLFERFRALTIGAKEQFLRAAFWYRHATQVHSYSSSASFLALIHGIEALMPAEEGATRCSACERPLGKSTTQRFVEFLEEGVPATEDVKSARRALYIVRSKLAHGGDLLRRDLDPWPVGLRPETTSEWQDASHAFGLSRLALLTWLAGQEEIL